MFRGIVINNWVVKCNNEINFDDHHKLLVTMCVRFYHECWRNRFKIMHEFENQKVVMINEIEHIKEDENSGIISNLFRY